MSAAHELGSRTWQPRWREEPPPRRFVEIGDSESAAPFVAAWEALAESPLEHNVFCEPWLLLPALDEFGGRDDARVGLVFDDRSNDLIGVFPFVRTRIWSHPPISTVSGWIHEQSFLGTPLLHADAARAKEAIVRFFDAVGDAAILGFDDISGDGEFMRLLTEVVAMERGLPWLVTNSLTRPVLRPRANADEYIVAALDGDARRKLRSKKRGLEKFGSVRVASVEQPSELEEWLSNFFRLEERGWKGRLGTAIGNHLHARRYFEQCIRDGFRRGRVMALTLLVGDRPVALKLNLSSGRDWFAYKIAYDEELARYSPGLQLEIENIRRVHDMPDVRLMDSCTGPTIRLFRDVWLERRLIHSVLVATSREPGPLLVAALPLLRWGKRHAERIVPALRRDLTRKPAPRAVAALPLSTRVPLPKRFGASPVALVATRVVGSRRQRGDVRTVLKHAVMLQCGQMHVGDFHDELDVFFGELDLDSALDDMGCGSVVRELLSARNPAVRRIDGKSRIGMLMRVTAPLSIRLDFELLRAGQQIPPHGHSRAVSGFAVVHGRVGVRRYDLVESTPDTVVLRPTFDGVLSPGESSTESDVRDNVHWIVAVDDCVLFRVTASDVPFRSPVPSTLNLWLDPRAPLRGDSTILGRWIPEAAARAIPPFVPRA